MLMLPTVIMVSSLLIVLLNIICILWSMLNMQKQLFIVFGQMIRFVEILVGFHLNTNNYVEDLTNQLWKNKC